MRTPSLAALALAVVCSPAPAEHFVDYDNPLIPTGLRPGASFHLVFATGGTTHRDAGCVRSITKNGTGSFTQAGSGTTMSEQISGVNWVSPGIGCAVWRGGTPKLPLTHLSSLLLDTSFTSHAVLSAEALAKVDGDKWADRGGSRPTGSRISPLSSSH